MNDFDAALMWRLDPLRRALCRIVAVLDHGYRKHPDDDGFRQPADYHVERARKHLELLATSDRAEDHLAHAATRLLMAVEARTGGIASQPQIDIPPIPGKTGRRIRG